MADRSPGDPQVFRIWIARYDDWRPTCWNQTPPRATALEPAMETPVSAAEAADYLEGYNRLMLSGNEPIWAVALPVTLRYEGDAQPGMSVRGHVFALPTTGENRTDGDDAALPVDRRGGR